MQNRIFSFDSPKAVKANKYGYLNGIHYMAPYTLAGVGNLCSHSTIPCQSLCLGNESGQAGMVKDQNDSGPQGNNVRASRIVKAQRFMRQRQAYLLDLIRSIDNAITMARRQRRKLAIRLNGSTDIAWEGIRFTVSRNAKGKAVSVQLGGVQNANVFQHYPKIAFPDYTKNPNRFNRVLPVNYHLTFSRSEANEAKAIELLAKGVNVAVVFGKAKPVQWHGFNVIDGDAHDLRHLDPKGPRGTVIALSPKGSKAKRDTSGFVVWE